ncbi:MAG: caspase family protein [Rubrivivax sp.]|nr:caspase family protein [Rubrivivax sp.]
MKGCGRREGSGARPLRRRAAEFTHFRLIAALGSSNHCGMTTANRTRLRPPSPVPWAGAPSGISRRTWLAAVACLAGPLADAAAAGSPRVALVVGNGRYAQAPLPNAVNDARAVAGTLEKLGFTVLALTDAKRDEMAAAVARAGEQLRGQNGVGLLYYAGHGVQIDWRNYMLPVDEQIESAADVAQQAIDVARVLAAFQAASTRMNIVVLDACRDNPFASGRTSGRGLAPMDAPAGTFLAYATAPGNVAEDGTASDLNGPYARFLVQELARPEARIEDVFKRVRFAVRRHTQGRQVPWESTSLVEDFSFARGIVAAPRLDRQERDEASARELADWQRVAAAGSLDDLYGYLQRYPSGLFAELARLRLEQQQRAAVQPLGRPGSAPQIDVTRRQYEVDDLVVWELHDRVQRTKRDLNFRVTSIFEERVIFSDGRYVLTQNDATVFDGAGEKSPPIVEVVADMAVGRRWRSAFTNTYNFVAYRNFYDSRVVALEELTTPMGVIPTFRVEHRGEQVYPDGRVLDLSRTTWVDAKRGRVLRQEWEHRWAPWSVGMNHAGRLVFSGVMQVVNEKPARR